MSAPLLNSLTLKDDSNIQGFDCGVEELNFYLKSLATLFQRRSFGVTVTFFEEKEVTKKVIAYYTVCPSSIQRDQISDKFITGPKPNPIPGFRLCRLAVDRQFQGKGIGSVILMHALKKCINQSEAIGGSVVIIDAKNEQAKKFYEHFGFISFSQNPLLLIQTIKFLKHQLS